jgi:dienelactone hydrolase
MVVVQIIYLLGWLIFQSAIHQHTEKGTWDLQKHLDLLEYDRMHDSAIIPDFAQVQWVQADRHRAPITARDSTWMDWLRRTGETPPQFDSITGNPFLPDPLVHFRTDSTITNKAQWYEQREWIACQVKKWITGTFPDPPDNIRTTVIRIWHESSFTARRVMLEFGPNHKAIMQLELYLPREHEGKIPVIITQRKDPWVDKAMERGYACCVYAGTKGNDDTEAYMEIYPAFDFSMLMRRAWGASRVIDYLYACPEIDTHKIAFYGHSRNGMQAAFLAAFESRLDAVIVSSGNGILIPWRYTDIFNCQTMDGLTYAFPYWFHPRIRFFIGNEHKMPVDNNMLLSMVAPRAMLMTSSIREVDGNYWAIQLNYNSIRSVYQLLGAEDRLFLRLRDGGHSSPPGEFDVYFDFLDKVFYNKDRFENDSEKYNVYDYVKWVERSGEIVLPEDYGRDAALNFKNISVDEWYICKQRIKDKLGWLLATENEGRQTLSRWSVAPKPYMEGRITENLIPFDFDTRKYRPHMLTLHFSGGDSIQYFIYTPNNSLTPPWNGCAIALHEFAYNTGLYIRNGPFYDNFLQRGVPVITMDLLGCRERIEEGMAFYDKHPDWSKMGKMVYDIRKLIDFLEEKHWVDNGNYAITGYNLGGTVALMTAVLDERIQHTAVNCAFTPFRSDNPEIEGIRRYSHLHGLIPRLGFFNGQEYNIPIDFDEMLSTIAPRNLLVLSANYDRHAEPERVAQAINEAMRVYDLHDAQDKIKHIPRYDINRFSMAQKDTVVNWICNYLQRRQASIVD